MSTKSHTALGRILMVAVLAGASSLVLAQEPAGKQLGGKAVPVKPTESAPAPTSGSGMKALDKDDVADYSDGKPMRYARAAELNGFPGPKKALEWAEDLKLTADQKTSLDRIWREEKDSAAGFGKQIVEKEKELDTLFKGNAAPDEAKVMAVVSQIAKLEGDYRAAHLKANVATAKTLTADQILAYRKAKADSDKDKKAGDKEPKDGKKDGKKGDKKQSPAKP